MAKKKKKGGGKCCKRKKVKTQSKFLLYVTYFVGFFDFAAAITITILSFRMLTTSFAWSSVFLLIFTVFWASLLIALFVGLWKNRPNLVRLWILFSCAVIIAESIIVIYGTFKEATIHATHLKSVLILLLGLFLEVVCVYIVFLFTIQIECECGKKKKCNICSKKDPKCEKYKNMTKKSRK